MSDTKTVSVIKALPPKDYKGKMSQGLKVQSENGEDWLNLTDKGKFLPVGYSGQIEAEVWSYNSKYYGKLISYNGGRSNDNGGPDWDKIAEGKVLCNMISAAITAGQIECRDVKTAKYLTGIVMGKATDPQGGDPNPEYSDNPDEPPNDGIPF